MSIVYNIAQVMMKMKHLLFNIIGYMLQGKEHHPAYCVKNKSIFVFKSYVFFFTAVSFLPLTFTVTLLSLYMCSNRSSGTVEHTVNPSESPLE
jgi:hypothetical protein